MSPPTVPGYFKVNELPPELRAQVDALLAERGHKDFSGITADVNELLEPHGLEVTIGRSSIHRYSQAQRSRIQEIQNATEFARQLREVLGDDVAALAQMGLQLALGEFVQYLLGERGDLDLEDFLDLAKAQATVARAFRDVRRYQDEYEERLKAAAARGPVGLPSVIESFFAFGNFCLRAFADIPCQFLVGGGREIAEGQARRALPGRVGLSQGRLTRWLRSFAC